MSAPWPERLAAGRRLVEANVRPPAWLGDQLVAAAAETLPLFDRLGEALAEHEPDRDWYESSAEATDERMAALLAGLLSIEHHCVHLRRGGPQPVIVNLALGRADCRRCVATHRSPPAADADRCDLCGAHGVERFTPLAVAYGPAMVLGEACENCAALVLGPERIRR